MRHPVVILMRTVKGRGVDCMDGDSGWHGKAPSQKEMEKALAEIEKGGII
jgi:transketolase